MGCTCLNVFHTDGVSRIVIAISSTAQLSSVAFDSISTTAPKVVNDRQKMMFGMQHTHRIQIFAGQKQALSGQKNDADRVDSDGFAPTESYFYSFAYLLLSGTVE